MDAWELGILFPPKKKPGVSVYTPPETNSSPLKIDPWKFGDSYWKPPFLGAMLVSGRVRP